MVVQAQTAAADGSLTGLTPDGDTLRVREVWQDNLEEEMKVRSGSNGQVRLSGVRVPGRAAQPDSASWPPLRS